MAFPFTVLPQRIDILLGGTWTDITSFVQRRDGLVRIRRGRSDEAAETERSTASMAINNRDGRFSVRNPNSPYYGLLNRNTPLRVSLPTTDGSSYLFVTGALADEAACPDAGPLGITGDIDIRFDARLDSWRGMSNLAGKYIRTGNQRSWVLQLNPDGTLTLAWSTNGTAAALLGATSTLPVPIPTLHRQAVRATLDVNNGSSGHTVTFYTATTLAGPWTQLGAAVITAGTTSIFDSSAPLEVGSVTDLTVAAVGTVQPDVLPLSGQICSFELRSGIDGTTVANPAFTAKAAGTTSFADTATSPNTWTLAGQASIDDRDYRFHGEVPSWPSRWDDTGSDVWVDIQASGILRRISQGRILQSTLRRALTTLAASTPIAYWPCEDTAGSTSLASGLTGGAAMAVSGDPNLASSSEFECSSALPVVNNSTWAGTVPTYTATGVNEVRFVLAIPAAGLANGAVIARVLTTGTASRWDVVYSTSSGGGVEAKAYNSAGTLLVSGAGDFGHAGHRLRCALQLSQFGADVGYGIQLDCLDEDLQVATASTLLSQTAGQVTRVSVGAAGDAGDAVVGHVSVHSTATDFATDLYDELRAYAGETATARMQRLCAEEGVAFQRRGAPEDAMPMGPQPFDTFPNLLREAAATDGGILFEPRNALGIGYRNRTSLYSQGVVCTLDYTEGQLFGDLTPIGDDQHLHNDVTVAQRGGTTAREVLSTGLLSPASIGTYPEQYTVNTQTSAVLASIATWRVALGTVDEERFASITVNLANPRIAADATLVACVRFLDVGDRLQVDNAPSWVGPGAVDQLLQGATEILGNFEHAITMNTSPSAPYMVAVADDPSSGRADTSGTILSSSLDSDDTIVPITTTVGQLWTTDLLDTPFVVEVGGEEMTVTMVNGARQDRYQRLVTSGWGVADSGETWTCTGGSASDFSVQGA